jgi:hypothetical protein
LDRKGNIGLVWYKRQEETGVVWNMGQDGKRRFGMVSRDRRGKVRLLMTQETEWGKVRLVMTQET